MTDVGEARGRRAAEAEREICYFADTAVRCVARNRDSFLSGMTLTLNVNIAEHAGHEIIWSAGLFVTLLTRSWL